MKHIIHSRLLAFVILFLLASNSTFSANRFWVGNGNWNNINNWSNSSGGTGGSSLPSSSDTVVFDARNTSNCNINIDANVAYFKIDVLYAGIISVNSGVGSTLSTGKFSQADGIFQGNNVTIIISETFTLSGGAFYATSGTLKIRKGYAFSGGKFNHNNGTVVFSSTQIITGNTELYNIIFGADGGIYTLANGTTLTSENDLSILGNGNGTCTINNGLIKIKGDLTLTETSEDSINGGSTTFQFEGTEAQNINSYISKQGYIGALPNIVINKNAGSLNFNGIINFNGASWNTIAGASLIHPGNSVVNILNTATLKGESLNLYDIVITGNNSIVNISDGVEWISSHQLTFAGEDRGYQINTGTLRAAGDVVVTNVANNTGGSATIMIDGNTNQKLIGSGIAGVGILPSVIINKTGGTLQLSSIISVENKWEYIAGSVDAISELSTVNFYNKSTIDAQGASNTMLFHHLKVNGAIALYGNLKVNGNITIASGMNNSLDIDAVNNYEIAVAGNWINLNSASSKSFNAHKGKVIFDGKTAQSIMLAEPDHEQKFYNMEINNSSSSVTLNAPVNILNNINFITGNIISNESNILQIADGATATGASNQSFVEGPLAKTGSQSFIFPIGKKSVYAPLAISTPSKGNNHYIAEYFPTNPNLIYNTSNKDSNLSSVSNCEYWVLNGTPGTANVNINLSWGAKSCDINNVNNLRVAQWDGYKWIDHNNGGTTGTKENGTISSKGAITSFGTFAIANAKYSTQQPLSLISFNVEQSKTNPSVELNWQTASEYNTNTFHIERSLDGVNFTSIGEIDAAGYSNQLLKYNFTDEQPIAGYNYYRLIQIDNNGISQFSALKVVNFTKQYAITSIYPNPFNTTLNINLSNTADANNSDLIIYNDLGEQVLNVPITKASSSIETSTFPSGIYIYKLISNNNVVQSGKIVSQQ